MGRLRISGGLTVALAALSSNLHAEEKVASRPDPPKGLLLRADGSLLPAFGFQRAQGRGSDGVDYLMEGGSFLLGGRVGVGLGYAFDDVRVGVRGAGQLTPAVGGGGGIPYTKLDGVLVYSVGPTFGLRMWRSVPIELEFEVAYAAQFWLGSQASIGAPDNLYPLGATQHGVLAAGRVLWRPLGWTSLFALTAGVNGMFGYARDGASVLGVVAGCELGVALGF